MKTYRGKIYYMLPIIIIPILLTIGMLLEKDLNDSSLVLVLILFWVIFLIPVFLPLAFKLEIGDSLVKKITFGFTTMELSAKDVESVTYGGMALWNDIYPSKTSINGKGLAILANNNGEEKVYGISERLYGKEAIQQVKVILCINNKNE